MSFVGQAPPRTSISPITLTGGTLQIVVLDLHRRFADRFVFAAVWSNDLRYERGPPAGGGGSSGSSTHEYRCGTDNISWSGVTVYKFSV